MSVVCASLATMLLITDTLTVAQKDVFLLLAFIKISSLLLLSAQLDAVAVSQLFNAAHVLQVTS